MKKILILALIPLLISCGGKKEESKNEVTIINSDDVSFMGISIGENADSAAIYIEANEEFKSKPQSDNYGDDFSIYPDYQSVRYDETGVDRVLGEGLGFDEEDWGIKMASFFCTIQTKSSPAPAFVEVYERDMKVNRIVVKLADDSFRPDLFTMYEKKYGESFFFDTRREFIEEKDPNNYKGGSDNPEYLGNLYKFKNNKRIFIVAFYSTALGFTTEGIRIVYEDATDYYNFLKENKKVVDKMISDSKKAEKARQNEVNTQDI